MELTSTAKPTSLRLLTEAASDFEAAQTALESNVLNAIRCGASWAEVGAILGVSKQTAHARYGKANAGTLIKASNAASKAAHELTHAEDKAALARYAKRRQDEETTSKISDTEVAGESVTPSIFSDAAAPAKRPNGPKADPDESIRNGITNTARTPIDWAAAQSLATTTPKKCPYCNQRTHYANRTGNWWIYGDCTITHDDLGTKAVQDSYKEGAK